MKSESYDIILCFYMFTERFALFPNSTPEIDENDELFDIYHPQPITNDDDDDDDECLAEDSD